MNLLKVVLVAIAMVSFVACGKKNEGGGAVATTPTDYYISGGNCMARPHNTIVDMTYCNQYGNGYGNGYGNQYGNPYYGNQYGNQYGYYPHYQYGGNYGGNYGAGYCYYIMGYYKCGNF